MKDRYIIVLKSNISDLQKTVSQYLSDGYTLWGYPTVQPGGSIMQAMVLDPESIGTQKVLRG